MIKNFVTKEKLFFGVFPQVKKINNPLLDLLGFIHFWIIWFSVNYLVVKLIAVETNIEICISHYQYQKW